jgi:hypothetical protein
MESRGMTDDSEQTDKNNDRRLLKHQFTLIFEYLINISRFDPPYILVLLDAADNVIGNKIVQSDEDKSVLSATDFVSSKGAEDRLFYPMHLMIRDANGSVAYVYLDDIDVQPEIKIVHVDEGE